jgi:hypothetical protein
MTKKIISFALIGLMLGSFAKTECAISLKKVTAVSAATILGLALYRLNSKKSEQDPKSRFATEKLKEAFKNKDAKEISNQIWYFIDDIVIGQLYKKDSIKADKEGKIEVSKGNPCSGIFGNIQSKIFPITTAIVSVFAIRDFFKLLGQSYDDLSDYVSSDC